MSRALLLLFLRREWVDMRGNNRVWPVYLILPIIGVGLPVLMAVLAPVMLQDAARTGDRGLQAMIDLLGRLDEFRTLDPAEGLTRLLLRNTAAIFLLLPVALASTSAAFSIVSEKQQRTLEPILATPITDRQFLLAKLLAAVVPTILVTLVSALLATVLADVVTYPRYHVWLLPDRFWLLGVFVLPPLLAVAIALLTMRLSARATDPQAAVQTTALILVPIFFVVLALFGRLLMSVFPALVAACLLVALADVWLFRGNVKRFQREEILTRWK